ncbi:MAG: putative metal-binding motif-containing protein [Pseudomonadota bacterium]|nr:putative metal-binding motif-containing protein [Pseudomonadota bacterium]
MTLLLLVSTARAATLDVGPTAAYATINAAVTASTGGDTIRVEAGTYAEDLDLRGRNLTVVSADGPAVTVLSPTASIRLDAGTLEGFTISPAPATAVLIAGGAPTLRELYIKDPATYGVLVSGGTPLVEEVGVWNAGLTAFIVTGGEPTLQRSVSYHPTNYGFAIKSSSTLRNCVAIGGAWGFVFETEPSDAANLVAVGTTTSATGALFGSTVTNSAFRDNPVALRCFSGYALTFPNGIAFNTEDTSNCTGTPLSAVTVADPRFANWSTTLPFEQIDLRPTPTSPMRNAGTGGTDPDGSVTDLGAFGGSEASWSDRDADGFPVVFDCDDHDANTFVFATEREDDKDNDCDGIVDEDIPVDTGGPDDTADTDVIDDTGDTDLPADFDLDGDGYPAAADCDEHNIATHPGAPEIMDSADNDCDGLSDEGTAAGDDDGDGYTELEGDCDDTRTDRVPGAYDIGQEDGIDNDCDGLADDAVGVDLDGDDHFDSVDDCDDTNPLVHASAADPTNGVDDDCDGLADDDDLRVDGDGDGQTPEQGDCNDADPTLLVGTVDIPDDFIDQDCNGTDNYDADRDGHASPTSGGADCDDGRSTVYPGAAELCDDNVDNDCDELLNEDCDEDAVKRSSTLCGCATGPKPGSLALLGLLTLGSLARRRRLVR